MEPNKISCDDPRLTALALGELEGEELAAVAAAVRADPALQQAVDEIRATAGLMSEALEQEPVVVTADDSVRPAAIIPGADWRKLDGGPWPWPTRFPRKVKTFPYWPVALGAAACFTVVFLIWQRDDATKPTAARTVQHVPKTPAGGGFAVEGETPRSVIELVGAEESVEDRFFATKDATRSKLPLRIGRASLDAVRARLRRGERPLRSEVRVAELVNAFAYRWPAPGPGEAFAVALEVAAAPWAQEHRLVRIGFKAREGGGVLRAVDAHVAVEFNPTLVRAWRLVGFENNGGAAGVRGREHAGENLHAGHALVALYEVVPAGSTRDGAKPLLTVQLDYREPDTGDPRTRQYTLAESGATFTEASEDLRLAASVAALGMVLQDSPLRGTATIEAVARWAGAASTAGRESAAAVAVQTGAERLADSIEGQRADFLDLVRQARAVLR
jgi:hypothetical protein